jgi:hypothetical protein
MSDADVIDLFATDSADRVRAHTATAIQARLDRDLVERIRHFAQQADGSEAGRALLTRRLEEVEQESDMERTLQANAAVLALAGTILAVLHNRRWLLVPGVVTSFLLQHALQGWCPPVALFRRLGVRTAREIATERYAIKALRGDFTAVASHGDADERTRAVLAAVSR